MGTKLEHPQSGCEKSLSDVHMQVHQPLTLPIHINSAYLQVPINNFKITDRQAYTCYVS